MKVIYQDARVKKSEIRCKLAYKKIFDINK